MCRVFARVASLLLIGCAPGERRGRKVEGTDGTGGQANVTLCLRQGDERGTNTKVYSMYYDEHMAPSRQGTA